MACPLRICFLQRVGHSETVHPTSAAVQPSILTFDCKILNKLILECYPVPMFVTTQPRRSLDSFPSLAPTHCHLPLNSHSPYTLQSSVSRKFFTRRSYENCRVCTQNSHSGTHPTGIATALPLFFSTPYALPVSQVFSFDIHPSNGGLYPPACHLSTVKLRLSLVVK